MPDKPSTADQFAAFMAALMAADTDPFQAETEETTE